MSDSTIAIIPARSGSKSVTDKNLALVGGHPLISYSIAVAKLSMKINRVIVSTDSEKYAEISRQYGAEVPFIRPTAISHDLSTDREFMVHAMNWFSQHENAIPEFWVHLRPTTPLRDPLHLDEALTMLSSRTEATALRSGHPCSESPFKWFRQTGDGYFAGLNSTDTALDGSNLPRQAYPEVFIPDGYVDIVRSSFVLNSDLLHGDRVCAYISPVCTELDSSEELMRLEYEIEKNGSVLTGYLESCI